MTAPTGITGNRRAVRAVKWTVAALLAGYIILLLTPWGRGITTDWGNDFRFDSSKPWTLEFGTGHFIHGLDLYEVHHTGVTTIRRRTWAEQERDGDAWYEHTLQLSESQLAQVVDALRAVDEAGLARAYQQARVPLPGLPRMFTEQRTAFALSQAHGEKLVWCFAYGPEEFGTLREFLFHLAPYWPPRPGSDTWTRLPELSASRYDRPLRVRVYPK